MSSGRGEQIANHEQPGCSNGVNRSHWARDADQPPQQVYKPRRDFPSFNGDNVYQWLFKCHQYFEITEMNDSEKLKQASYYMDDRALYWHQNFIRHRPEILWSEYIDALCCRFGGQNDPLEELKDLEQKADLETYIQEFDILWNRAEITERQALVFFLGGLEVEIKNMVKMFEPKTLYQAYNLARLQENTISHRHPHHSYSKNTYNTTSVNPPKPFTAQNNTKPNLYPTNNNAKPVPYHQKSPNIPYRPTKTLRNKELDERRAKGLCFWCDEKFIPGHRCKNKRVYSLCIMEDEDNSEGEGQEGSEDDPNVFTPQISINALEGTSGFQTLRVTGKVDKTSLFIMVDSGSTHNFINT